MGLFDFFKNKKTEKSTNAENRIQVQDGRPAHDEEVLLFFDTETNGLPLDYNAPSSNTNNWPRLVQLSWILATSDASIISKGDFIIKPKGFTISSKSIQLHGITNERANNEGVDIEKALEVFLDDVSKAKFLVGHNINFDMKVVGAELYRLNKKDVLQSKRSICTMKESINFCAIPTLRGYKYPKLQELYYKLFGKNFSDAHNSASDTQATMDCFFELLKRNIIRL